MEKILNHKNMGKNKSSIFTFATMAVSLVMLTSCVAKTPEHKLYIPDGSMGMDELTAIAQDTSHFRALIFTSPYCYGCRQAMDETRRAVEAMDTSLWRVYYLIVEDIADSAHWQQVVDDMVDLGARREWIHHCSLPFGKDAYRDVVALFRTAQPLDNRSRMEGVPFELVVDTNNFIPVIRCKPAPDADSEWFELNTFIYEDYLRQYTDFSIDDGSYVVNSTSDPAPETHVVVLEK